MLQIETRPDLGSQRDEQQLPKWINQRVDLERDLMSAFDNKETPVTLIETMHFQQKLLDTFIPLGIQRARHWGLGNVATGATTMLEDLLFEIREAYGR